MREIACRSAREEGIGAKPKDLEGEREIAGKRGEQSRARLAQDEGAGAARGFLARLLAGIVAAPQRPSENDGPSTYHKIQGRGDGNGAALAQSFHQELRREDAGEGGSQRIDKIKDAHAAADVARGARPGRRRGSAASRPSAALVAPLARRRRSRSGPCWPP